MADQLDTVLKDAGASEDLVTLVRKAIDDEQTVARLQQRIDSMSEEVEARQAELRQKYLDKTSALFNGYDWKKGLAGAPVEAKVSYAGVCSAYLRLPSNETTRQVVALVSKPGSLGPIALHESALLEYLVRVELPGAGPGKDLSALPVEGRLAFIRELPTALSQGVASLCQEFQGWLSVVLGNQLGKS